MPPGIDLRILFRLLRLILSATNTGINFIITITGHSQVKRESRGAGEDHQKSHCQGQGRTILSLILHAWFKYLETLTKLSNRAHSYNQVLKISVCKPHCLGTHIFLKSFEEWSNQVFSFIPYVANLMKFPYFQIFLSNKERRDLYTERFLIQLRVIFFVDYALICSHLEPF